MRSNGSWWRSGSFATCSAASSAMGRGSMPWASRCAGTNTSGGEGSGSLPRRYLTAISQAEAALSSTSLAGSANASWARAESSFAPPTIQRKVQVSRSRRTASAPFERIHEVLGQRLEERAWHPEAAEEADRPPRAPWFRHGPQLRDRDVPPADQDRLAVGHAIDERRELDFGLVNVDLLHDLLLD